MALTPEQRKVLARIVQIGRQQGASPKELKAAIETGLVESNLRNLSGGDADSAGWRQERASIYPDPTNLNASITRFFKETHGVKDRYGTAGALAAAVQRPAQQFRGRYQQRSGEAQALLGGDASTGYAPSGGSKTSSKVVGGVDNSQGRKNLALSFLLGTPGADGQRNTSDPLQLALAAQGLKDQPGHLQTTTTPAASGTTGAQTGGSFGKSHSPLLELIHKTGTGPGYAVKNGQEVSGPGVYGGVWDGHQDHVHVAAGPKTVVNLGEIAQDMGLHVGENPHFGGVNPVHAKNSYHYKGEAIDVSGDPKKMAAFAKKVEQLYGLKPQQ